MGFLFRFQLIARRFGRDGLQLLMALRHPRTPRAVRIGTLLLLAYIVSPIDLVPEMLAPLLGWADDFALLALGIPWLLRRLPDDVAGEARGRAGAVLARFGLRGRGSV